VLDDPTLSELPELTSPVLHTAAPVLAPVLSADVSCVVTGLPVVGVLGSALLLLVLPVPLLVTPVLPAPPPHTPSSQRRLGPQSLSRAHG